MSASYRFEKAESYRDCRANITIDGGQDVFRFMVNMLDAQVEFHELARGVLVELREHLTSKRFDPMAKSLLGEQMYKRYAPHFQRSEICCACEQHIKGKRWPAGGYRAFCKACSAAYGRAGAR